MRRRPAGCFTTTSERGGLPCQSQPTRAAPRRQLRMRRCAIFSTQALRWGLAGVGRGAAAGVVRDRSWRLRTGALCRRVENVLPAGRVRSAGSPLSAGPGRRGQELGLYEHALQQYAAAAALQLDSPGPCCMAPSACMRWVVAATPWIRSTWCLSCAARRSVRPCANGPSCCAGAMHVPTETAPCPPSRFQFEEVRYVCFSDFARLFRGRPCL